jgi:hypothetical protein
VRLSTLVSCGSIALSAPALAVPCPDADGDTVCDAVDQCPAYPDASQLDLGLGSSGSFWGDTCLEPADYHPSCAFEDDSNAHDMAASFTVETSGLYRFETTFSLIDTVLELSVEGSCGEVLACNDDTHGYVSVIEQYLDAGTHVRVVVDAYSTYCGYAQVYWEDCDADDDRVCDDQDFCVGPGTEDSDGDGVCDGYDLCCGEDTLGDPDGDGICALPDPTLVVPPQVVAGDPLTLSVTGAHPNRPVFFVGSRVGAGPGPCTSSVDGCDLCADVVDPVILGRATTDRTGAAALTLSLQPAASFPAGSQLWFQAVYIAGSGAASNVGEVEVVAPTP